MRIEDAILSGNSLDGSFFDAVKCFNLLPIEVGLRLLERLGMDAGILRALEGFS